MGVAISEGSMSTAAVARGEHVIVRDIITQIVTPRASVALDADDEPYPDPCALPAVKS